MNGNSVQTLNSWPSAGRSAKMLPSRRVRDLIEVRPFEVFGRWGAPVTVARPGTMSELAGWIATEGRGYRSQSEAWQRCQRALPHCFTEYTLITLRRPSLFLPAGDVVFQVTKNPVQIPEDPPTGVLLRHFEAMDAFPEATFYFLQPVFDDELGGLYSADELRRDGQYDQDYAFFLSRLYGWAFRSAAWGVRQMDRAKRLALGFATRGIDQVNRRMRRHHPWLAPAPAALRRARNELLAADVEAREFRRALSELRAHLAVDPILCFELPDRPGLLWFEAHWYLGANGKRYVHF